MLNLLPFLLLLALCALPSTAREAEFTDIFDPRTSPVIPIPEVGTDPNAGTTLGLLPVFLTTDENRQITRILAPDILIDPQLGLGGNVRVLAYPSADTHWYAVAGAKEKTESNADLFYETGLRRADDWSFSARALYDRTASSRFFGLGNTTPSFNETNYTAERAFLQVRLGRNFSPALQLALDLRPRWLEVEHGRFAALPSIETRFPAAPGRGPAREFLMRIFLTYDTRDLPDIPGRGSLIIAYAGATQRGFLSTASYGLFGFDSRHYLALGERDVLALHAALRYMVADSRAPFWALSSLGGESSIPAENQSLRSFGADRFIDRNMSAAGIELRHRLFNLDLFSTRIGVEAAPFLDVGQVFHNLDENPVKNLHAGGGIGFRAIASPFVVGYVDIGFGTEGGAVFSGIDYPF